MRKLFNDNIRSIEGSIKIINKNDEETTIKGTDISNFIKQQQDKIDELTNFAQESLQIIKQLQRQ